MAILLAGQSTAQPCRLKAYGFRSGCLGLLVGGSFAQPPSQLPARVDALPGALALGVTGPLALSCGLDRLGLGRGGALSGTRLVRCRSF